MTQEEKQLLLIDLCARLRDRIWVKIGAFSDYTLVGYDSTKDTFTVELVDEHGRTNYIPGIFADDMKPYLRPMSSMTEEEHRELRAVYDNGPNGLVDEYSHIDWLNANHFDYRGLIPKGLALEAPEEMYSTQ